MLTPPGAAHWPLLEAPVVMVTAPVARVISPYLRELHQAILRQYRRDGRSIDPEVAATLRALDLLGRAARVPQTVPSGIPQPDVDDRLNAVSTKQAAQRLGVTDRNIRYRLEHGTLAGAKQSDGRWLVWLNDEEAA